MLPKCGDKSPLLELQAGRVQLTRSTPRVQLIELYDAAYKCTATRTVVQPRRSNKEEQYRNIKFKRPSPWNNTGTPVCVQTAIRYCDEEDIQYSCDTSTLSKLMS